jgi:hypothetical protein
MVANLSTAKLAALNEITLFGIDEDIKLMDVFERMKAISGVPDAKADGTRLRKFFREVAPDHDEEKVYASDMKKVISWYMVLKDMPLFNEEAAVEPVAEVAPAEVAQTAEEPVKAVETTEKVPAKPKAKKPVTKKAE